MSKEVMYRQCRLEKKTQTGVSEQVSWIPSRYAVVGRILELKEGESWDNGWQVISAGAEQDGAYLIDRSQDYKRTRSASDV